MRGMNYRKHVNRNVPGDSGSSPDVRQTILSGIMRTIIYEKWRCPFCGEPIGYIGRVCLYLFGTGYHECRQTLRQWENIDISNGDDEWGIINQEHNKTNALDAEKARRK